MNVTVFIVRFIFLVRLRSLLAMHGLPPAESEPLRTLKAPPLLSSFRGHIQGITSLTYVDHQMLMISSSSDGNVSQYLLYYTVCYI